LNFLTLVRFALHTTDQPDQPDNRAGRPAGLAAGLATDKQKRGAAPTLADPKGR